MNNFNKKPYFNQQYHDTAKTWYTSTRTTQVKVALLFGTFFTIGTYIPSAILTAGSVVTVTPLALAVGYIAAQEHNRQKLD